MAPKAKFNLMVYSEDAVRYDREEIESKIKELADNPEGPADDPMFADNMSHNLEGVYLETRGVHPIARVELSGTGFVGDEAAIVSKTTIDKMEEIILQNSEGEHYTTSFSADAL